MKEEEFKENLEKQLNEIGIVISKEQAKKLYDYMRFAFRMEPENEFNSN